jgi:hypothetical protein
MRSLKIHTNPNNLLDPYIKLFKTDMFQEFLSYDGDSPTETQKMFRRLVDRPLITFDMDDYGVENSHFTSWMGFIQNRDYDNPYIHDLFLIHELGHWATMEYDGTQTFDQWHKKMSLNEYYVAALSEAHIYFEMPELRSKTFTFEIWVDRFLRKGEVLCLENLQKQRDLARRSPDPSDFQEMQLHLYALQNYQWSLTWQKSWRAVETEMSTLLTLFKVQPHLAATNHIMWIKSHMEVMVDSDNNFIQIPFRDEAFVFQNILKTTLEQGGNQILKKKDF